jgi:hypothetical protein
MLVLSVAEVDEHIPPCAQREDVPAVTALESRWNVIRTWGTIWPVGLTHDLLPVHLEMVR